jgi:hypothetical protein
MATKKTHPDHGFTETICDSWDDFLSDQRKTVGRSIFGQIFRGHGDHTWQLSSVIERWLDRMRRHDKARNLRDLFGDETSYRLSRSGQLEFFKELATGLPGFDTRGLSEVDWLALARHNGLRSPLLDWSRSPFVAAFFAVTETFSIANGNAPPEQWGGGDQPIHFPFKPFAIWALSCDPAIFLPDEFELVLARNQINYWQKAQSGVFTSLKHDTHLDLVSYLASKNKANCLECFVIAGQEAGKVLRDCERMNITYATLFPELRGAAIQANIGYTWTMLGGN